MNNPKIWVSGSRGFVGRHLVSALKDSRCELRCVTKGDIRGEEVIYVDFSRRSHIRKVINSQGVPDIFIHLGWGSVYEPQSEVHLTSNISDGKNLIDELYECGLKKFILVGSSSEYGDREGPLSEDMEPMGRLTNYVKGKMELSSYGFEAAKRLDKAFIHIRLFYAFGAGQHKNSLISQLYRSYLEKTTMNLSPCEHYRDYIYISDVVKGIQFISDLDESAIVNLGSGRVIQLRDFVRSLWQELGGDPGHLIFGAHQRPGNEPGQPYCFSNPANLNRLTRWTPSISVEEGIGKTVEALKEMGV